MKIYFMLGGLLKYYVSILTHFGGHKYVIATFANKNFNYKKMKTFIKKL